MPRFMSGHSLPPGGFTRGQLDQFAQAAQQDPVVQGYRSFANLSEGRAVCILDAPSKEAIAAWFEKMGMPYDNITRLELEGDRGSIQEV
ncbi:MAG: DUF4242 domain-containing protein [Chloroflexi bacterium]|nr:DUF4242 domain-containing protein [Chloroflexota bacterium]